MCKIVFYLYCIFRTYRFTFFASDAGVFASLACIGAFVLVVAHHDGFGILRNHGDDVLRTNGNAHSATETAAGVHVCNAVLYADGVVRASVGAIAQTETAEAARLGATVKHGGGTAGADAVVNGFFGCGFTVSVAMHECNDIIGNLDLDAECFAECGGGILRARNAKIGLCRCVGKCGGIVITAFIAASAAVDTGQTCADLF